LLVPVVLHIQRETTAEVRCIGISSLKPKH